MTLRFHFWRPLTFLLLLLVAGCKDDAPVEPGPGTNTGPVSIATLYDTAPNVAGCSEGVLKESERQKVLNYVNAIRQNHGLAPVQYSHADDRMTAKAALIIAASSTLSHQPVQSVSCWSQDGFEGSGVSNLAMTSSSGSTQLQSSESFIDLWMKDSTVESLGHRRWLIDPFLKFISFGRVDKVGTSSTLSGSAIRIIYEERQTLGSSTPEFVAFPFHETSARLFNSGIFMSFSAVADRTSYFENSDVSYSSAIVTIRTEGGEAVPVTIVGSNNDIFGLGNVLLWTAPVANDTRYLVTINGVMVKGVSRNYDYWFTTKTTV